MASLAPSLPQLAIRPITCSPPKPWGIHPVLVDETCPRCGWTRAEPRPRRD